MGWGGVSVGLDDEVDVVFLWVGWGELGQYPGCVAVWLVGDRKRKRRRPTLFLEVLHRDLFTGERSLHGQDVINEKRH